MSGEIFSAISKSALVALLLFSLPVCSLADEELPRRRLSVTGMDGQVHDFEVEVASTPREREKGLMFRDAMEDNTGMLFAFPKPRRVNMWMANTHIALDMLFIIDGHSVIRVKHDARPMDRSIIDSGGDVSHVLEINAGLAAKLGISKGSIVRGDALEIKSSH